MLEISNLSISYGEEKLAVKDFNLQVKKGEIIGIVGESGSGKTTVIKSIIGALPENAKIVAGDIQWRGKSMLEYTAKDWHDLRGVKLSMIFQDCGGSLNPIRTIGKQFVEYILIHEKLSKKDAWDKAQQMLTNMRLPDAKNIMNSYPHQLSGGMRQRVGIAMAMTYEPELLLADEPTSALDVTTQAQIVRQMMELRENFGTSIIIVTHNLGVASYMSDEIIVMQNGNIEEHGKTEEIIRSAKNEYTKKLLSVIPEMGGRKYV